MKIRLSFAEILQKKKGSESRINTSRSANQQSNAGSRISSQYYGTALPSLI